MNKPSKLWKQSVRKWERIVKLAEKENLSDGHLREQCGFCEEFSNIDIFLTDCRKCPLYKDNICSNSISADEPFWKIMGEIDKRDTDFKMLEANWKRVIKLCEKVLKAVKRNRF